MERVESQRELLVKEPRFDEGENLVLPFEADLQAQAQLLAAAGEARPVEKIKITLGDFDKPQQAVDGTESRAEGDGAGALLLQVEHEILPVRNVGRFGGCFNLREVAEILQARDAGVHADGIVDVAGIHSQLAANDLVLRLGIAADLDLLNVRQFAFP